MREKYKLLARDTLLFGISNFASKIIIFLLLPIYTSILTTTEYGTADLIINVVNLLYPLFTLSIVEAVLRFAFEKKIKSNELIGNGLILIFVGTLILLILLPLGKCIGGMIQEDYFLIVLLFGSYSLQNLFSSYCRGKHRSKLFAMQGILQTICILIYSLVFLFLLKMGKTGYLLAIISAYDTAVLFMLFGGQLYKEIFPLKINIELFKDMVKYSIPLIPAMMAWWLNNSVDKYTIIGMVGVGASGIYAVAHKIPTMLTTFSDIFNQAFLISAVNNIEDNKSIPYFRYVSKYFFVFNCLMCNICISFSEIFAKILFAKEYMEGWIYVPILLFAAVFSNLSAYLASFFRSLKNTKVLLKSTIIGAILNLVLNILLVNIMGTIGAAYATAISFIVVFGIRNVSLSKIMKLDYFTMTNVMAMFVLLIQAIIMSLNLNGKYMVSVVALGILVSIFFQEIKIVSSLIKRKMFR